MRSNKEKRILEQVIYRLKLLAGATSEDDIRAHFGELLNIVGFEDVQREHQVEKGAVDIVVVSARLAVETKTRASLQKSGKNIESPKAQLARYLSQLTAKYNKLKQAKKIPWLGILTDGKIVQIFKWQGHKSNNFKQPQPREADLLELTNIKFYGKERSVAAKEWLEFVENYISLDHRLQKPEPPADLFERLLEPKLGDLANAAEKGEKVKHFETKFEIWKSVLGSSGMKPPDNEVIRSRRLFREHTALVSTARGIVAALDKGKARKDAMKVLDDGFVSWLNTIPEGREWAEKLFKRLDRYNWSGTTRDVLRNTYERLIKRDDRKEFGEYYTPDWLAEKICKDSLDVAWLERSIDAALRVLDGETQSDQEALHGIGVLDPSCGSGTFLYHAARRIVRYAIDNKELSLSQASQCAAALVHGIDIHPVAVEMSRAVLSTALPGLLAGGKQLSVSVGDALQTKEFENGRLWAEQHIEIPTFQGKVIYVPNKLLNNNNCAEIINYIVKNAVDCPHRALRFRKWNLDQELTKDLKKMHGQIEVICKHEGNHVWEWMIRNTSKPLQLSEAGVDRLIGNPPWLVANDTEDGARKKSIAEMQSKYGLSQRLRGSSAKGDLAAIFCVRAISRYLPQPAKNTKLPRKFAFVLPGSALIGQTWEPFRSGKWELNTTVKFDPAWNLNAVKPPPFSHAPNGTCVVRGESAFRPVGLNSIIDWQGDSDASQFSLSKPKRASTKLNISAYNKGFSIGTCCRPLVLCMSTNWDKDSNSKYIKIIETYKSTKGNWRGLKCSDFLIEREVTHEFLRAQKLKAFSANPDAILLLPVFGDPPEVRELNGWPQGAFPKAQKWFSEAQKLFAERRSAKSAKTLLRNIDWKKTASVQLAVKSGRQSRTKVVYNKSGTTLRAARINSNLMVDDKCYYTILPSVQEAQYLTAILNAPVLQDAWRQAKTANLHYDKNPLKRVPVPSFMKKDDLHIKIAVAGKNAERFTERNNLAALDKALSDINEAVAELLPEYVTKQ